MKLPNLKNNLKDVKDKPMIWLLLIFALVLAIRLFIAFQTPLFNYDAYFNLRQVEHIKDSGFPLYKDPLSYGGKTQLFAPLNDYVLATFSIILPVEIVGKIIPNIFAAMIIFIAYYLAFKITKNNRISLATSFMSGFMPIYFIDINRVSVNYLAVLLVFTIVYCMLKLNDRKYVDYSLILMFLLVLATPMAFVLVIGLLLYLLLLKLENFAVEMKELEIILFFTFLVFWVNLLIYKNAFLTHGLLVVWQNIPIQILSNFFSSIGFVQVIAAISIIPIVFGVYAFYAAFHLERSKEIMILVALGLSAFILVWFKLLDLINGLIFLSITLVILTAYTLKRFSDFIEKSKIHKYHKIIYVSLLLVFIISVIPSVLSIINSPHIGPLNTPSRGDVEVLKWASVNLPQDAVITAGLEEGNIVSYYAKRKNVMDTNFLLTPRIDQRLKDLDEVYTTSFETKAIGTLNTYDSKYILVSPENLKSLGISEVSYIKNNKCFLPEYYSEGTYLYSTECKIE
jgi:hypothetical protein